jgi:uncharacterized protein (TIGR03435 family)
VFEAATIKKSSGDTPGASFRFFPGGRFVMTNAPIRGLILSAFPTETGELVNAPDWIATDRYDVNAKAEGDPPQETMQLMLQSLLRDRIKLRARYEERERDVYFLNVARPGQPDALKLKRSSLDCAAMEKSGQERPRAPSGAPLCGVRVAGGRFEAHGVSLALLVANLGSRAGRVVIDRTGLTGEYEFVLEFATRPEDTDRPSVFAAVEEQLGLKLEAGRAPLRVLVIDQVERPTDN